MTVRPTQGLIILSRIKNVHLYHDRTSNNRRVYIHNIRTLIKEFYSILLQENENEIFIQENFSVQDSIFLKVEISRLTKRELILLNIII